MTDNVEMEDLKNNMCRWPFGDPQEDEFHFCGKLKHTDQPYCRKHIEMAYRPDPRRSKKSDKKKAA